MQKLKSIYLSILIGIFISSFLAIVNLSMFDKLDGEKHLMIVGDINLIWQEAEELKNDIIEGKNYFESGIEYTRTYLPSKILVIYSSLIGSDLFQDPEKKIVSTGDKFYFLLFQIILYYSSILFFYKALKKFYIEDKIPNIIVLFLCFEPTILQYHISFWTESIYCSLLIILLTLIIDKDSSYSKIILTGFILGLMYLQKTVSIFLFLPVIFYLLISIKQKKIYKVLMLLTVYLSVIIFLGFHNYKKTGIFYILPIQTKDAHYSYILPQIFEKNNNLEKIKDFKSRVENDWKNQHGFDENSFKDFYEFNSFKQKIALREMLNNKLITVQIYIKKIFHHILLNPVQSYYWHEYNKQNYEIEYHLSADKENWLKWRIIYSFFVYAIVFAGFFNIIKYNHKLKFHFFLILILLYYAFMLGWVGNTRYFTPSIIILSIFFGNGIYSILNYIKKYEINTRATKRD